jgi:hypothetical protein
MKGKSEISYFIKPLGDLSIEEKSGINIVLMNCRESTVYNDIDIIRSSLKYFPEFHGFTTYFKLNQEIIAYFPFIKTISNSNHFYFSPFQKSLIPYGGIILHDDFKKQEYEIVKLIRRSFSEIFHLIYIKSNPGINTSSYINNNLKVKSIPTLIIDLNKTESELWSSFNNRTRRNIKKAENYGIDLKIVVPESLSNVEPLALIYKELCEKKRLLYHSERYYFDLLSLINSKYGARVFYAVKNGNIISAMSVCFFKKKINPWFGGTLNEFYETGAGSMLYWEILKFGCQNGYETFDFLGLDVGPIAFYKKGFGGTEVPVYHISKASILLKIKNKLNKWGILKVK